jgi:hypothetical protein
MLPSPRSSEPKLRIWRYADVATRVTNFRWEKLTCQAKKKCLKKRERFGGKFDELEKVRGSV